MKYLKKLGFVAVWMGVMMAYASNASATVLTSPPGVALPAGVEVQASAESSLLLRAGFANITCTESVLIMKTENPGGPVETVRGPVSHLTFSNCNATVHVLKKGSLEFHVIGNGPYGTVTSTGTEVTVSTLGTSCTYGTKNTDIGNLTGSAYTTTSATLDVSASLTKTAGGFLCNSPAPWEGSYVITSPWYLDVS